MTANSKESLPALEGLRGFACLLVVFTHMGEYGWWKSGVEIGAIGVLLFFNLSGFLMAYNYLPGEKTGRYWVKFLIRRILRVYPAYVFVATLVWFFSQYSPALKPYDGYPLKDIWLINIRFPLNRPFWTMAVELNFYIYFCIFAAFAQFFRIPNARLLVFCAVLAGLLLLLIATNTLKGKHFYLFFIGGVLAGLLLNPSTFKKKITIACPDAIVFTLLALLFGYIAYGLINHYVTFKSPEHFRYWMRRNGYCFAPLFVFFILSIEKSSKTIKYVFFSNSVIRFIGRISYSLYLSHVFVICTFMYYFESFSINSLITLSSLVIIIAYYLYILIEKPFNNLGKKL